MRKFKLTVLWLAVILLVLLTFGCFALPGYRFSGCVGLCIILVILCYRLLRTLSRKDPKTACILQRILTVALCLFLLAYAVTGVIVIQASYGNPQADCDYLIVLGAGVNGTVPSLSLRNRLDAAFTYLQAHPDTICVLSGGKGDGENITEAECMFRYLTAAGIPEERLIKEDRATSTRENLAYSLLLMESTERARIGVLSSEYHLYRASLMARDQGIDPIMIPAETTRTSLRMNYYMREVVALWYYLLIGG